MQLLLATSNQHKVEEVAAILAPMGIDVVGLGALESKIPEPVEDGATFQANARIKAVYYAKALRRMCLADDSGLEVDALGSAPGVHSARFAGVDGQRAQRDGSNNEKLLAELQGVPAEQRTARFVCAMCLVEADGSILAETCGTFPGIITTEPRGENGFGYDPLLYLPDVGCTSAELSPQQKNARSHRGVASREMARHLKSLQRPGKRA